MENERLQKLRRQKELLLEHLEWINLEIDQEVVASAPSPAPARNRLSATLGPNEPVARSLDPESRSTDQVASDVYDELGPDTANAAASAKKGCLLISAAAFAAFAGIALYVTFYY